MDWLYLLVGAVVVLLVVGIISVRVVRKVVVFILSLIAGAVAGGLIGAVIDALITFVGYSIVSLLNRDLALGPTEPITYGWYHLILPTVMIFIAIVGVIGTKLHLEFEAKLRRIDESEILTTSST